MAKKKATPTPEEAPQVVVDHRVSRWGELRLKSPLTPAEWVELNNLDNDLKTEGKI